MQTETSPRRKKIGRGGHNIGKLKDILVDNVAHDNEKYHLNRVQSIFYWRFIFKLVELSS